MSFDSKLLQYCDHRVVEEDHVADIDLKTVYLDLPIANYSNVKVKVNGTFWDQYNQTETLTIEDVSSQITGSSNTFVASKIPMYDGTNKGRLASRVVDATVIISIINEDASPQFTNLSTNTLLVTQHRHLTCLDDIYAIQLIPEDVIVTVNSNSVTVISIEPIFGKITLVNPPPMGAYVTVSYSYKAHIISVDGDSGSITIKETPAVGQNISLCYFDLEDDGWSIITDNKTLNSNIIFDKPKQTNNAVAIDENVSSQFTGLESTFTTQFKPIVPPRANLRTLPQQTFITQIFVSVNGTSVMPLNLDAVNGIVNLGFVPAKGSTVLVSYNYRRDNITDIISVDYQTIIDKCRKCIRTSQVNDFGYDNLGLLIIVKLGDKMLQDLLKLILAVKGSNTANPFYGTSLTSYIGTAKTSDYYIVKFKGEIIAAGNLMKGLQIQQTQYQVVDDEEFFSFLDNITVVQNDIDPDLYDIDVDVVSQAAVSLPLTTSLMFNTPLLSNF